MPRYGTGWLAFLTAIGAYVTSDSLPSFFVDLLATRFDITTNRTL